jgi:hypothetical protein
VAFGGGEESFGGSGGPFIPQAEITKTIAKKVIHL